MFDPTAVKSASDLPTELPVVIENRGNLELNLRQPLFYNFHWLREIAFGVIDGDLGLKIDAGGDISAKVSVSSSYRTQISLDERGWLRLEVHKQRQGDFDFAAGMSVSAQAQAPLPDQPDALVAAILGVHDAQRRGYILRLGKRMLSGSQGLSELWNILASRSGAASKAGALAACLGLDGWARKQIEALVGPVRSEADIDKLLAGMRTLLGLRDSIYSKAINAFEKKYSAEVSYVYKSASRETALLDCSFAFTDRGLAAYRQALEGNYSWMLRADPIDVDLRQGVLTDGLRKEAKIELHLPFLDRRQWSRRLEALARMEVSSDGDGRVLVYQVEATDRVTARNSYQSMLALAGGLSIGRVHASSSFTLTYCDQRQLSSDRVARTLAPTLKGYGFGPEAAAWLNSFCSGRSGNIDVSLALSIPGSLASAWLDAPDERDPEFFPVYARVSVAVQRAIRVWLPYVYFSDPERYKTLEAAFPLVVYQASRPFSGRPKYDFNYDVMNDESMAAFFRMAAPQLPAVLARIEELLSARGENRTASFYDPKQARRILASVQQRPKLLQSLLVADAFLVDALINLGCRGRGLKNEAASDPAGAVKSLSRFAAELVKAFHSKMRRLYGGREFLEFGALLLVEATAALKAEPGAPSVVQAVLRVSQGASGQPGAIGQTLVNRAYIPQH